MKTSNILLSVVAISALSLTGCGSSSSSSKSTTGGNTGSTACTTYTVPSSTTLSGDITECTKLTANKTWILDGLVAVKNNTTLKIEAGTTIAGKNGTGANTSYMVIDKGSKILAEGTAAKPIIFTSKIAHDGGAAAWGQWGGLTIIGKAGNAQVQPYEVNEAFTADSTNMADNSGVLKYVQILNSGITMEQDKEVNGLSLVGVGSGTTIDHLTVNKSDDDCVETWGGTVNFTNVTLSECSDDHFDIDDGYAGTVKNLVINQTTGNAGIEMSGTTAATFDGFTITQTKSNKEGGIYFKKDGIGGHFKNGKVIDNSSDGAGAINSKGTADVANISFENVKLEGTSSDARFTGDSADAIEAVYNKVVTSKEKTLAGDITSDMTLTADTVWILDGLVAVKNGATLTIEAGTTIAGKDGTAANTSYMVIDKGSKILAEGTAAKPIIFTSKIAHDGGAAAWGQWGGLTIIGKAGNAQVQPYEVNEAFTADSTNMADNSGVLKYVQILNSGITMEQDKEVNGLSLVGVGSGTTIDHLTVNKSDDDCVETWGGTVNFTNVTLSECSDDHFDIDDGYAGTVKNLVINQTTGNAGIEMSGTTAATFDGLKITQTKSNKEGGIYFKKAGIGGHFKNATIIDNSADGAGAINSKGTADVANISFENVKLEGTSADAKFTGDSADAIEAKFDAGSGNTK